MIIFIKRLPEFGVPKGPVFLTRLEAGHPALESRQTNHNTLFELKGQSQQIYINRYICTLFTYMYNDAMWISPGYYEIKVREKEKKF